MIKNFDNSFNGANTSALTPILIHTVVMIAAMMKYKMNIGNALFKLNLFDAESAFPDFAADFARIRDNTSVIGIIASVRVSFTVTAVFSVSLPRFHILSQVEAAAVTEEVSLIAVPANNPKDPPPVVSKPSALPSTGNCLCNFGIICINDRCGGSDRRSSADGRTDTNQDGSVRRYFDNFTEQPCDDQGSTDGTYDDRE